MRSTRTLISAVGVVLSVVVALAVSSLAAPTANATTAAPAAAAAPAGPRAVGNSYDAQVLYWTNVARAKSGLRALKAGPCVDRFAERWTARMAARSYFGHQKLRPILRSCNRRRAAENIAKSTGGMSAYAVVRAWMRSPGHRRNILNPKYKALGVSAWRSSGTGTLYVTQDFAG